MRPIPNKFAVHSITRSPPCCKFNPSQRGSFEIDNARQSQDSQDDPSPYCNYLAQSLIRRFLGPRRGGGSSAAAAAGGGRAPLLAGRHRGPAIRGALSDLGKTLSDGGAEVLPPSVTSSDGIHVHVGAESSQEQDD